jgi:hypothetical protein
MTLTSNTIHRAITGFPECIECGMKYFHAPFCQHGRGLSPSELARRLKDRVAKLQPDNIMFCHCGTVATGTAWVSDHRRVVILEARPVCGVHAEFDDSRPHGVVMNVVTNSTSEVQTCLHFTY